MPRSTSVGALRSAFFISVILAACAPKPAPQNTAVTTRREQRRAVAKVFETATPYSVQKISDADIRDFLAKNQDYAADSQAISEFYRERGMQYAWVLNNRLSANAESFVTLAGVADGDAPKASVATRKLSALYDAGFDGDERIPLCETCGPELELRLTGEFFRFARRNTGGFINTDVRDLNWFIPSAKKDFSRLVDSISHGKMDLASYEPVHPQYKLLQPHLQRYAALVGQSWPELTFPAKRTRIKLGDSASVVRDIRHRLQLLGDFEGDTLAIRYDSSLRSGVKDFQTRHGMNADGIIDAPLLKALNVTPAARLRTIIINMERLRWVAEQQPANLLLVNIPEFRLHVFEADSEVMTMNTVVGARGTRTVTFTDTLTQIVFSPSWNVPSNIVKKEILPAMAKDKSYLAKHDMEITGGSSTEPEIRQRPGAMNALGRVKFLFPNSYSIYMHDTPTRGTFANETRAASHGCIRLSKAGDLAEYLLRNDPDWPVERIHEAMLSGNTQMVKLKEPRPVAITYITAWVDRDGQLNFRDDVYGHDADLAAELFAPSSATAVAGSN